MPIQIKRMADGTHRLVILGKHIHHGLDGLMLTFIGIALMWHDRADFPFLKD